MKHQSLMNLKIKVKTERKTKFIRIPNNKGLDPGQK